MGLHNLSLSNRTAVRRAYRLARVALEPEQARYVTVRYALGLS